MGSATTDVLICLKEAGLCLNHLMEDSGEFLSSGGLRVVMGSGMRVGWLGL